MRGKHKILVVDDSRMNRMTFTDILQDSYEILEAENGEIALRVLEKQKDYIALIILDLMMPVMDGFQFLKEFKQKDVYGNIPVIVATTSTDIENECRCLELGVWDFIPKVFHPRIIRFRVFNAIDKSKIKVLEYDSLTGIYNQQKFFQRTRELLDSDNRKTYAFIHLSVERFMQMSSLYGPAEASRLLCALADAIRTGMKGWDQAAYGRVGNEEFGICMPYEHRADLLDIIRIIKKMAKDQPMDYYLEIAAGIYLIEDRGMEVPVIYDKASVAGRSGAGNYMEHEAFYTQEMDERLAREQRIINEMHQALEEEQFVVYFQPKYELDHFTPCGAEALVRWKQPDGSMISPGEFIPVFEKNGFIIQLDYYVWERVCRFIREEIDAGRDPAPISVNISRVNLYNPKFYETLVNLVSEYKIPLRYLHLELTESAFSDSGNMMMDAVEFLHHAGFTILMDDFGSGYSSLNTLKDIDMDVLKIDMKFLTRGQQENSRSGIILEAVISMAHSLGMLVITEGVEERGQVDFLKSLGCDYIQGYYFARPMPMEEYRELICGEC